MSRRAVSTVIFAAALLVWFLATPLLASRPGEGMNYTSEESIEYAQSILDHEGYLERGDYTSGRRDRATKFAIADFQRRHRLNSSGRLDFDTMAMLSSHEAATAATAQMAPIPPQPPAAPEPRPVASPPPPPPAPEPPPPSPAVVAAAGGEMEMPATAGPIPLLALSGSLLAGLGLLIMLRRPV